VHSHLPRCPYCCMLCLAVSCCLPRYLSDVGHNAWPQMRRMCCGACWKRPCSGCGAVWNAGLVTLAAGRSAEYCTGSEHPNPHVGRSSSICHPTPIYCGAEQAVVAK
jgi:hypothetical protein